MLCRIVGAEIVLFDPDHACGCVREPVFAVLKGMQVEDVRFVVVLNEAGKAIALTGQRGLMEYIADHGTFDDVPLETLVRELRAFYPEWTADLPGNFEDDTAAETSTPAST